MFINLGRLGNLAPGERGRRPGTGVLLGVDRGDHGDPCPDLGVMRPCPFWSSCAPRSGVEKARGDPLLGRARPKEVEPAAPTVRPGDCFGRVLCRYRHQKVFAFNPCQGARCWRQWASDVKDLQRVEADPVVPPFGVPSLVLKLV